MAYPTEPPLILKPGRADSMRVFGARRLSVSSPHLGMPHFHFPICLSPRPHGPRLRLALLLAENPTVIADKLACLSIRDLRNHKTRTAQQFEMCSEVGIRSVVVVYPSSPSRSDYQPDMNDKAAGLVVKKRTSLPNALPFLCEGLTADGARLSMWSLN